MAKYNLVVDLEEGVDAEGNARDPEKIEKYLRIAVQQALTKANCLINRVEVKQSAARPAGAPRTKGTAGRKPINRPKIEAWIREHVTAGPSTQGTMGLHGVDRTGKSNMDAKNRVYPHILALPEPDGVGLTMPAISKVLGELDREGYLERGFAAGAPFYELIRPLEAEGLVGVRGREEDDEDVVDRETRRFSTPSLPRVIDFSNVPDEALIID
ncbi:hypothetical protein SEA_HUWBERT_97 [Microbacterium phage Huwbert]|nr:hypothetical protein SEA_HUWBERT_97 [Microbacterium phage Huwbert]